MTDCEFLEEVNFVQNKFNSGNNFQKSNWNNNRNNGYYNNSREDSGKDELKEMLSEFIQTKKNKNVIFTQGLKDVNDKLITSNKQHFAAFNEIERKLGRISEKLEERPSGKFGGQTQPNPAQNVPSNSGKYVPPISKTEQANVIISENRSGNEQLREKQETKAGQPPWDQWAPPTCQIRQIVRYFLFLTICCPAQCVLSLFQVWKIC